MPTTEKQKFIIELDCAPFTPRPDYYIDGILEGTGLVAGETISRFFGCWTWEFEMTPEAWNKIRPTIIERITALYNGGSIRYGGWS